MEEVNHHDSESCHESEDLSTIIEENFEDDVDEVKIVPPEYSSDEYSGGLSDDEPVRETHVEVTTCKTVIQNCCVSTQTYESCLTADSQENSVDDDRATGTETAEAVSSSEAQKDLGVLSADDMIRGHHGGVPSPNYAGCETKEENSVKPENSDENEDQKVPNTVLVEETWTEDFGDSPKVLKEPPDDQEVPSAVEVGDAEEEEEEPEESISHQPPYILRYKKESERPKHDDDYQNTPPSAINNISWENLEPSEREYYEKLLERVKEQARDLSYREPKENLKKIKKYEEDAMMQSNLVQLDQDQLLGQQQLQPNFFTVPKAKKTLTYILSSQRCMNEGWTVQHDTDEKINKLYEKNHFQFQQQQEGISQKQKADDDITMKSYPSGETWMVFHKNQSGNIWYQSGNLAATFTPSTTSHHCNDAMICILYEDQSPKDGSNVGNVCGIFHPNGNCFVQKSNKLKVIISPLGGDYFSENGHKLKTWSWKYQDSSSRSRRHDADDDVDNMLTSSPSRHSSKSQVKSTTNPFQPILVNLNKSVSVRILSQNRIFLHFNCSGRPSARFNVSIKFKFQKLLNRKPQLPEEAFLRMTKSRIKKLTGDHKLMCARYMKQLKRNTGAATVRPVTSRPPLEVSRQLTVKPPARSKSASLPASNNRNRKLLHANEMRKTVKRKQAKQQKPAPPLVVVVSVD